MKKLFAEFAGTAILVIVGCGSAVVADFGSQGAVGVLAISLAFGLVVTGLAYAIGPISGCHINPAVTVSLAIAGRFKLADVPGYVIAQCAGAIAGAAFLYLLLEGRMGGQAITSLGQNGWGEGYLGQFTMVSAFLAEVFATFVLCLVVLASTRNESSSQFAGLAIGLTIAVLLMTFINVSGASLNPARSLGPALLIGQQAISQLWLFIVAPLVGAAVAALADRALFANHLSSIGMEQKS